MTNPPHLTVAPEHAEEATVSQHPAGERWGGHNPAVRRLRSETLGDVLVVTRRDRDHFDARDCVVLAHYVLTGQLLDYSPVVMEQATTAMAAAAAPPE